MWTGFDAETFLLRHSGSDDLRVSAADSIVGYRQSVVAAQFDSIGDDMGTGRAQRQRRPVAGGEMSGSAEER
jgi:hypothetical protein